MAVVDSFVQASNDLLLFIDQSLKIPSSQSENPSPETVENLVIHLKIKADTCTSLAECCPKQANLLLRCAVSTYEHASAYAAKHMAPTNRFRLHVALNHATCLYESCGERRQGRALAHRAYAAACGALHSLQGSSDKPLVIQVLQLLRDRVSLWDGLAAIQSDDSDSEDESYHHHQGQHHQGQHRQHQGQGQGQGRYDSPTPTPDTAFATVGGSSGAGRFSPVTALSQSSLLSSTATSVSGGGGGSRPSSAGTPLAPLIPSPPFATVAGAAAAAGLAGELRPMARQLQPGAAHAHAQSAPRLTTVAAGAGAAARSALGQLRVREEGAGLRRVSSMGQMVAPSAASDSAPRRRNSNPPSPAAAAAAAAAAAMESGQPFPASQPLSRLRPPRSGAELAQLMRSARQRWQQQPTRQLSSHQQQQQQQSLPVQMEALPERKVVAAALHHIFNVYCGTHAVHGRMRDGGTILFGDKEMELATFLHRSRSSDHRPRLSLAALGCLLRDLRVLPSPLLYPTEAALLAAHAASDWADPLLVLREWNVASFTRSRQGADGGNSSGGGGGGSGSGGGDSSSSSPSAVAASAVLSQAGSGSGHALSSASLLSHTGSDSDSSAVAVSLPQQQQQQQRRGAPNASLPREERMDTGLHLSYAQYIDFMARAAVAVADAQHGSGSGSGSGGGGSGGSGVPLAAAIHQFLWITLELRNPSVWRERIKSPSPLALSPLLPAILSGQLSARAAAAAVLAHSGSPQPTQLQPLRAQERVRGYSVHGVAAPEFRIGSSATGELCSPRVRRVLLQIFDFYRKVGRVTHSSSTLFAELESQGLTLAGFLKLCLDFHLCPARLSRRRAAALFKVARRACARHSSCLSDDVAILAATRREGRRSLSRPTSAGPSAGALPVTTAAHRARGSGGGGGGWDRRYPSRQHPHSRALGMGGSSGSGGGGATVVGGRSSAMGRGRGRGERPSSASGRAAPGEDAAQFDAFLDCLARVAVDAFTDEDEKGEGEGEQEWREEGEGGGRQPHARVRFDLAADDGGLSSCGSGGGGGAASPSIASYASFAARTRALLQCMGVHTPSVWRAKMGGRRQHQPRVAATRATTSAAAASGSGNGGGGGGASRSTAALSSASSASTPSRRTPQQNRRSPSRRGGGGGRVAHTNRPSHHRRST